MPSANESSEESETSSVSLPERPKSGQRANVHRANASSSSSSSDDDDSDPDVDTSSLLLPDGASPRKSTPREKPKPTTLAEESAPPVPPVKLPPQPSGPPATADPRTPTHDPQRASVLSDVTPSATRDLPGRPADPPPVQPSREAASVPDVKAQTPPPKQVQVHQVQQEVAPNSQPVSSPASPTLSSPGSVSGVPIQVRFDRACCRVATLMSNLTKAEDKAEVTRAMKELVACYDAVAHENAALHQQLREAPETDHLRAELQLCQEQVAALQAKEASLKEELAAAQRQQSTSKPFNLASWAWQAQALTSGLRLAHRRVQRDMRGAVQEYAAFLRAACFELAACWSFQVAMLQKSSRQVQSRRSVAVARASAGPPPPPPPPQPALTAARPAAPHSTVGRTPGHPVFGVDTEDADSKHTQPSSVSGRLDLSDIANGSCEAEASSAGFLANTTLPNRSAGPPSSAASDSPTLRVPKVQVWVLPSPLTDDVPYRWPLSSVAVVDHRTVEVLKGYERHIFAFDHVQSPGSSPNFIADNVRLLSEQVLGGRNVCIAAYGDSGTGKTHVMQGPSGGPGVIDHAVSHVMAYAEAATGQARIRVSLLAYEVLGDRIRDLLSPSAARQVEWLPIAIPTKACRLELFCADDWSRLRHVLFALRHSRDNTQPPTLASRISFVLSLLVETTLPPGAALGQPETCASALTLVELPAADVPVHPKEASTKELGMQLQSTRQTLFTFGDLLTGVHQGREHLPLRNSKLTCLLQSAIDRDTLMVALVCIDTARPKVAGILKSLLYASRIKQASYAVLCDEQSCKLGREESSRQATHHPPAAVELLNCTAAASMRTRAACR